MLRGTMSPVRSGESLVVENNAQHACGVRCPCATLNMFEKGPMGLWHALTNIADVESAETPVCM